MPVGTINSGVLLGDEEVWSYFWVMATYVIVVLKMVKNLSFVTLQLSSPLTLPSRCVSNIADLRGAADNNKGVGARSLWRSMSGRATL